MKQTPADPEIQGEQSEGRKECANRRAGACFQLGPVLQGGKLPTGIMSGKQLLPRTGISLLAGRDCCKAACPAADTA